VFGAIDWPVSLRVGDIVEDFGVHGSHAQSAFLLKKLSNEATSDSREVGQHITCGYTDSLRAVSIGGRRRRSLIVLLVNGDPIPSAHLPRNFAWRLDEIPHLGGVEKNAIDAAETTHSTAG
jgi:hypothetical protein